jgi:hypothetical protein
LTVCGDIDSVGFRVTLIVVANDLAVIVGSGRTDR